MTFSQSFFEQNVSYSENYRDFQRFFFTFFESKVIFFEENVSVQVKNIAIFSDFCYFEIKPEMRDVLTKM